LTNLILLSGEDFSSGLRLECQRSFASATEIGIS